eukprot:755962-Hanusia_phi.AAC.5
MDAMHSATYIVLQETEAGRGGFHVRGSDRLWEKRNKEFEWEARFRELCLYRMHHGTCNVPRKYQVLRGSWTTGFMGDLLAGAEEAKQNAAFKKTSSRCCLLSPQRAIGFLWEMRKSTPGRKEMHVISADNVWPVGLDMFAEQYGDGDGKAIF